MVGNWAITKIIEGILQVVGRRGTMQSDKIKQDYILDKRKQSGRIGVCGYGQGQLGNLYCLPSVHYAMLSLYGGG